MTYRASARRAQIAMRKAMLSPSSTTCSLLSKCSAARTAEHRQGVFGWVRARAAPCPTRWRSGAAHLVEMVRSKSSHRHKNGRRLRRVQQHVCYGDSAMGHSLSLMRRRRLRLARIRMGRNRISLRSHGAPSCRCCSVPVCRARCGLARGGWPCAKPYAMGQTRTRSERSIRMICIWIIGAKLRA